MQIDPEESLIAFLKSLPEGSKIVSVTRGDKTPESETSIPVPPIQVDQWLQSLNGAQTSSELEKVFEQFFPETAEDMAKEVPLRDFASGAWNEEAYHRDFPKGHHMVIDVQRLCDRARTSAPGLDEAVMACVGDYLDEEVRRAWGITRFYRISGYRFAVPVPRPKFYFEVIGRLKDSLDRQALRCRMARKEVVIPAIPFRSSLAPSLDQALSDLS